MAEKADWAPLLGKIRDIVGFDILAEDDLLESVSTVNLAPGQVLYEQGEKAQNCFVVLFGSLKIIMRNKVTESLLAIISKGEIGGALLMGTPPASYPGSVVALTQVCLLIIPKETYNNHWTKHTQALSFINTCVQNRMRHLQEDKIRQLSPVENRVVGFLYRHYVEKQDLTLKKITRKDIALAVGAKTETVIRTLKKLERAGIVRTNNSIISILDKSYFTRDMSCEDE